MKGTKIEGTGLLHKSTNTKIVHLFLEAGEDIKPHNHEGNTIYFMVCKGALDLYLDGNEHHDLQGGDLLMFDGSSMISAKAKEKSDIYVFLIKND